MKSLKIFTGIGLFALIVGGFMALSPKQTKAVSGSDWNAVRIIDDHIFFNGSSMNPGDIQNFLNAKVPSCDTNGTQPSTRSGYATRADWGRANGAPPPYICLRNFTQTFNSVAADSYCSGIGGGTKSGADIIFNVAQACGINPKVLLVLLQKEQSLVTDDWPWPIQYRSATGYGCPDTAPCDAEYYGFFNQVYNAGRQFKRYVAQADLFNYGVGRTSHVGYNPNAACGGTNLTLQTQATAALYNYTPYQPNGAALANLYGTGDACSAYGNRNFWRMFNDWFGPTLGDGYTLAVNQSDNTQWVLYGGIKQLIPSPEIITAYGLPSTPVPMSASYLATIPSGPPLGRLLHLNGSPTLYFVDGGKKYQVANPAMRDAWGLTGQVESYVSGGLFSVPQDAGFLTYAVKNANAPAVYMVEGPNGSGQQVLRHYDNPSVLQAWEGDAGFITVSENYFSQIDNAVGTPLTNTKIAYGGSEYQIITGRRMPQPGSVAPLYPGVAQSVSSYTFNRLTPTVNATHLVRSANSPSVYLLDGGVKHHVLWSDVLSAWSIPSMPLNIVNDGYMNLIPSGSDLYAYTATAGGQTYIMNGNGQKMTVPSGLNSAYSTGVSVYSASTTLASLFTTSSIQATGFIKGVKAPEVYLLDSSGQKRHLNGGDFVGFWGGWSNGITILPDGAVGSFPTSAAASLFVSDGTNSYIMDAGAKWTVSNSVKTAWGLGSPQVYSDGTLSRFPVWGAMQSSMRDGGNYYIFRSGAAYMTIDHNIADAWGINGADSHSKKLLSGLGVPGPFTLTRFVKSSTDSRTFIVDAGNWYNLSSEWRSNLGSPNESTMTLNPSVAPNTITDWSSVVVKDWGGTTYVINGGGKNSFANSVIKNHWTNNGSVSVPTVTVGFLNLLPNKGPIERAIKGSAPAVYSAEASTKRWIRTSNAYWQLYAPYATVSDSLINVMPNGSDIY